MMSMVADRARLLADRDGSRGDLATHAARHGTLPRADRLIAVLDAAGLTGRGGAGFPTARKLAAVASGRDAVVVGNAAEGEPASNKDKTLLAHAPHLVLDGLQLAAAAVGARRAYLYLPARATALIRATLAQRAAARWDPLDVELVTAPDTFVSGEESAVVARINGRAAVPGDKWRRVVETGVHGAPTLVQNVETLAHLALIARYGPDWFRRAGTAEQPGTFLATISGAVAAPGVYEAEYGVPMAELLARAGGATAPVQAVLAGGYHGAWLPGSALEAPVSRAGLAPFGASPGAGVLVVLPAGACGLRTTAEIVSYLAAQSTGQCGPCRNGLPAIATVFGQLAGGTGRSPASRSRAAGPEAVGRIEWLSRLVAGRGACHHPDGTARLVDSALRTFVGEVDLHLAGGCTADQARGGGPVADRR